MKRETLIGQTLLLAMMSLLASSLEEQSLKCYGDYIELLTCEWNISSMSSRPVITPETRCSLQATCYDFIDYFPAQSDLVPMSSSQPELLKATVKFTDQCLDEGSVTVPVKVQCGGITVVENQKFDHREHIKLHPPEDLQVDGVNVSWKLGSPHQHVIINYKFQMQFKPLELSWEDEKVQSVEQNNPHCKLNEDNLTLNGQYEVRVRSIPNYDEGIWSDWSPSIQWTSTVGKTPPDPGHLMPWLFPSVTGTAVIIISIILLISCRSYLRKFLKSSDIHSPFGDLYEIHKGDMKAWLGPIVISESFIKADTECISPLEVYKAKDLEVSSKNEEDNSRSFSNSMYFLSRSSKCSAMGQLEPCSEDCPYGPTGGGSVEEKTLLSSEGSHICDTGNNSCISEPLETSSSYKDLEKLRLDVHSPDSGFATGSEDQDSHEESGSEGLPSPPVMDNGLPISHILTYPVPQAAHLNGFPHLPFLPSLYEWSPEKNSSLSTPSSFFTNTSMDNPDFMACSGMLEPASEDYMPVKKVQE